jgi:hypothetical protein
MITSNTAHRISRRGVHPHFAMPRLSVEAPCLHPDVALDDTGR